MKLIPYNKMSTVRELIRRALDVYLIENSDTVRATQPLESIFIVLVKGLKCDYQ